MGGGATLHRVSGRKRMDLQFLWGCVVCVCPQCESAVTCWSIPTESRPWYMMLTHPSLEASTNRDMRAWRREGDRHTDTYKTV